MPVTKASGFAAALAGEATSVAGRQLPPTGLASAMIWSLPEKS
jgi:hypothetical protein